jgi:hypothetical protein
MIKNNLLKIAFWILKKYEIRYLLVTEDDFQHIIDELVEQVELKFKGESGEFKRAQVLRAALNIYGESKIERDIAYAIEVAVRKHS